MPTRKLTCLTRSTESLGKLGRWVTFSLASTTVPRCLTVSWARLARRHPLPDQDPCCAIVPRSALVENGKARGIQTLARTWRLSPRGVRIKTRDWKRWPLVRLRWRSTCHFASERECACGQEPQFIWERIGDAISSETNDTMPFPFGLHELEPTEQVRRAWVLPVQTLVRLWIANRRHVREVVNWFLQSNSGARASFV